MPVTTGASPSKSEINRAGAYLAEVWHGDGSTFEWAKYTRAFDVVSDFRAAHSRPLGKVSMGLRSMVNTERCEVAVSQRLKRTERIARKIHRMGSTNLARLEDIGGTRAILGDLDSVQRVYNRIMKRWGPTVKREHDYIAGPKPDGYRARHVVVERDGRRIEIQLRTVGQQLWADRVEAADAKHRLGLKDGKAPELVTDYFRSMGEVIYIIETGVQVPNDVVEKWVAARHAVAAAGYDPL